MGGMTIYSPVPENSYLRDCIETTITELPNLTSLCNSGNFVADAVQIDFGISGISLLGYDQFFQPVSGDVWENPDGGDNWFDNDEADVTGYWFQVLDEARWNPGIGSWNGTGWDSGGNALILEGLGGWMNGIRPTKVRLTFTVIGPPVMNIIQISDKTFGYAIVNYINVGGFPSGLELDLVFQGAITPDHDILDLAIFNFTSLFTVTNIEFFLP